MWLIKRVPHMLGTPGRQAVLTLGERVDAWYGSSSGRRAIVELGVDCAVPHRGLPLSLPCPSSQQGAVDTKGGPD